MSFRHGWSDDRGHSSIVRSVTSRYLNQRWSWQDRFFFLECLQRHILSSCTDSHPRWSGREITTWLKTRLHIWELARLDKSDAHSQHHLSLLHPLHKSGSGSWIPHLPPQFQCWTNQAMPLGPPGSPRCTNETFYEHLWKSYMLMIRRAGSVNYPTPNALSPELVLRGYSTTNVSEVPVRARARAT